jgi:hypothetical protein
MDSVFLANLLKHVPMLLDHVARLPPGSPVTGLFLVALLQMLMAAMANPAFQQMILALIMKLLGGGA